MTKPGQQFARSGMQLDLLALMVPPREVWPLVGTRPSPDHAT